ncbi:hypothetical protein DYB28_006897 [Aphanomyces astaci]|uniref:Uncharacterized protein n=1 Tax=Aphanomyces astaci TaxID=112090 RepID=A0A9X8DYN1_APHAT|nr:hypothetical protein DYB28_006897 [Aphanomyces astaci]
MPLIRTCYDLTMCEHEGHPFTLISRFNSVLNIGELWTELRTSTTLPALHLCNISTHREHDHPREHDGDYERTEAERYHHEPDDESKDGDSDYLRCQDLARESTSNRGRDLFDLRDIDDGNERGVGECDFDSNIENRDPDDDSDRHRFKTFQDDT